MGPRGRGGGHLSAPNSTSLLTKLLTETLDPGYVDAARRGSAPDGAAASARRQVAAVVAVLLLAGLLLGTAAAQTRRRAPDAEGVRAALTRDVEARASSGDELARQANRLREAVTGDREAALARSTAGAATGRRLAELSQAAALTAVAGPGIRVRIADATDERDAAEDVDGAPGVDPAGRVLDRDLQDVVNSLWLAGAEAVAVGGQRISATTAIRAAGGAILVDFRPVSSPYQITAIGARDALRRAFEASPVAQRLRTYTALYGLQLSVFTVDELRLPAAGDASLRLAQPLQDGGTR